MPSAVKKLGLSYAKLETKLSSELENNWRIILTLKLSLL